MWLVIQIELNRIRRSKSWFNFVNCEKTESSHLEQQMPETVGNGSAEVEELSESCFNRHNSKSVWFRPHPLWVIDIGDW